MLRKASISQKIWGNILKFSLCDLYKIADCVLFFLNNDLLCVVPLEALTYKFSTFFYKSENSKHEIEQVC